MQMTDHWSQFRLITTEANCDKHTLQQMFVKSWNKTLQQAWLHQEEEIEDVDGLAQWVMKKEDKKNYIDTLTGKATTTATGSEIARISDGTFTREDQMDQDATRRRPNLNLSMSDFQ